MNAETGTAIGTGVLCLITLISVIVAVIALHKANHANANAEKANTISEAANLNSEKAYLNSQGDSELLLYNSIAEALRRQDDYAVRLLEAKERQDENSNLVKGYETLLSSARQGFLNAYDVACQRYLDNKVDKVRFEKTYRRRIADLFEQEQYRELIKDRATTRYQALWLVHKNLSTIE